MTTLTQNTLFRDHQTGLRVLSGEFLRTTLSSDVCYQLQLIDKEQHEALLRGEDLDDDEIENGVNLEVFFSDVNCGLLTGDSRSTRSLIVTSKHIAIYTNNGGVLKHKVALEDIRRIEFFTTNDDSAASVLIVLRDVVNNNNNTTAAAGEGEQQQEPSLPIVFSFLLKEGGSAAEEEQKKEKRSSSQIAAEAIAAASGDHRSSSSVDPNSYNNNNKDEVKELPKDMSTSPTSRLAEFRMIVGCLARIRCEAQTQELMAKNEEISAKIAEREAAAGGSSSSPASFAAAAAAGGGGGEEGAAAAEGQEGEKKAETEGGEGDGEAPKQDLLDLLLVPVPPTHTPTIVVIAVENSVRLDLLLRSLASKTIERAQKGQESSVAPLEVPQILPGRENQEQFFPMRQPDGFFLRNEDLNLVETIERLCRKEKDLCFLEVRDSAVDLVKSVMQTSSSSSSSSLVGPFGSLENYESVASLVEGFKLWTSARKQLSEAAASHIGVSSYLETAMAELEKQQEFKNEQILKLADDAQKVTDKHKTSLESTRREVEQIDGRIREMEKLLQRATDSFTEAMTQKDRDIAEAKQSVDKMKFNLTKGEYAMLPTMESLRMECEKLESSVEITSARAEELHISAPDKSVLLHLTAQLGRENQDLQEEILKCKEQRRSTTAKLIRRRMTLGSAGARAEAGRTTLKKLEARRAHAERHGERLESALNNVEKRVANLQQKLRRFELEAVVVDDLKREEMMHLSIVQSVRQDIKADLLERRKAERMMKAEQDRLVQSASPTQNHHQEQEGESERAAPTFAAPL